MHYNTKSDLSRHCSAWSRPKCYGMIVSWTILKVSCVQCNAEDSHLNCCRTSRSGCARCRTARPISPSLCIEGHFVSDVDVLQRKLEARIGNPLKRSCSMIYCSECSSLLAVYNDDIVRIQRKFLLMFRLCSSSLRNHLIMDIRSLLHLLTLWTSWIFFASLTS